MSNEETTNTKGVDMAFTLHSFSIHGSQYLTGETPKVGATVGVKLDHETGGLVKEVRGNELLLLVWCEDRGREVQVEVFASDCWID